METADLLKMNEQAMQIIEKWNPFNLTSFSHEHEALQVSTVLQEIDDPSELGKSIQRIFEQSFKKWVPLEKCVEVSYKLLAIKFTVKNIL